MNVLTFDIEEWYIEKAFRGNRDAQFITFDDYLCRVLDLLERQQMKATFFCLGKVATDFPYVVKMIADKGHEIGCHSNKHVWLNKMNREDVLADTKKAVDAIEQCIGEKVQSYRAPAFSIGMQNRWAFEVLAECGIERDASVFPASRDFGGFPQFGELAPSMVNYQGITVKEFPVPTTKVFGKSVAFSGGGYFRFFPLWFIKKQMAKWDYNMFYFHLGDLIPETKGVMSKHEYEKYFREPGTLKSRYKRYVKGNLGKKHAFSKMEQLMGGNNFLSLEEADKIIDWNRVPIVSV